MNGPAMTSETASSGRWRDLGVRGLSAAVLIPVVLVDVWLGEWWFVAFVAVLVLNPKKPNFGEILTIGTAAFATFAVLDTFTPSIAVTARQGAGFGLGANLVGFPRV